MVSCQIDNKNTIPPRSARRQRGIHSFYTFELRALRDLRGEISVSTLVAALPRWVLRDLRGVKSLLSNGRRSSANDQ